MELAQRGARGVFHCCGGEAATRMGLAQRAAEAFSLDAELLRSGSPEPDGVPPAPVPYDTSLDARVTARALGREPPTLEDLLARFREERPAE
jgi:dTDP-4-dehydrorhamnose reductase